MDGLRKVPDNVPNRELLEANLGKPLSRIPNPFPSAYESFAAHNNAMLRGFLDQYGFDYEFVSAADRYNSGGFDDALRNVLRHFGDILDIMLPTLREERRLSYSPILPILPSTGRVLQVPVEVVDAEAGSLLHRRGRNPVRTVGARRVVECQWSRLGDALVALEVDYEMYGKDLTDSGVQSGRIAAVLGGRKPEGLIYEMFLDEKGEKISKSKGNGLSLEQWLTYGSDNSLAFYLYREPKKAKNLHLGLVPRAVDEYLQFRGNYEGQETEKKLGNPVHHIHGGHVPAGELPLTFGLLLNLVSLPGVQDKDIAWKFVQQYAPDSSPEKDEELDSLIALGQLRARFRCPDARAPAADRD